MTRLLVLDDDVDIGNAIRDLAEDLKFDVAVTTTPAEFVKSLAKVTPDLITLDLVLPGGDGIEMLRLLESHHYRGAVVLVSGMDDKVLTTARRLGIALGLDVIGSVHKPFQAGTVRELLRKVAERHPIFDAADFRAALNAHEFVMYYQPIVEMNSNKVLGAEAVIRWARPDHGLVMPDVFLPSVAREGMMGELTSAVIKMSLADASRWAKLDLDLRVSINVPASVALNPAFFDELAEARKLYDPKPPLMTVELTETEAMGDPVRMMEVLSRLRLCGIKLAIDDFGTGFSSLVELRRLPFNYLKIDKSFVLACVREDDAAAITHAIIDLSHALGISVVAEGVETQEIWQQLIAWRCDSAQGYLISRPMPCADLAGWLKLWQQDATGLVAS
jgi:EAL domain-containing protein (putative c-di-GMP-specific phosphodiesterase class I)/ActR/RegA family two-component response regulator